MTATRDDERVAHLIATCGHAGYGLWWAVLEEIGKRLEKETRKYSLTYPIGKWASLLNLRPNNVLRQLEKIAATGLLTLSYKGASVELGPSYRLATIELAVPNILKYLDEYQTKSRHYHPSETEADTDTDTEPLKPPSAAHQPNGNGHRETTDTELRRWFAEEFWIAGVVWAKIGVDKAESAWVKRIRRCVALGETAREAATRITAAARKHGPDLIQQAQERAAKDGGRPSPLHPATWLNAGRDMDEESLVFQPKQRDFMEGVL